MTNTATRHKRSSVALSQFYLTFLVFLDKKKTFLPPYWAVLYWTVLYWASMRRYRPRKNRPLGFPSLLCSQLAYRNEQIDNEESIRSEAV